MVVRPRLTPEVAAIRKAVRDQIFHLTKGKTLLVAVSGGADSLALASAAAFEGKKLGLKISAVIIDHGIQKGSDQIALRAAKSCSELGLDPVVIEKVEVKKGGDGLEAEARTSRYRGIEKIRKKLSAEYVLLGHNQDDQAETVLLGLARGSGLRSIAGMEKIDEERKLLRPLLDIPRADLRKACSDQGIKFWDDPHNKDVRFARVRVRKLAQKLEENLGPGFQAALARTADLAREADDALGDLTAKLIEKARAKKSSARTVLDVKVLALAKEGVRRKALHLICQEAGAKNISRSQILQVEELITNWHGQKKSTLSGITVERVANQLVVTGTKKTPGAK